MKRTKSHIQSQLNTDHISTGTLYTVCKQKWKFWAWHPFIHRSVVMDLGGWRRLMRSRIAKWCRGIGGGCLELVVNETVEEPADGVRGTFLCVFNAVIHDRVWLLYTWEDVKFPVTFGLLQLSYYKDFWNKQEKSVAWDVYASTLLFWAWGAGGEAEAPPSQEILSATCGFGTTEP